MAVIDLQNGANITFEFNSGPLDGGTPAGNANTLQFNANGVFGSVPFATYNSNNNLTLGSNSNIKITGGTPGQFLITDGAGNLTWGDGNTAGSNTPPGGVNTNIQFNNNGDFGGISTVTWDGSNLTLGDIGNVKLTGGNVNDIVQTDGTGNISFVHPGSSIIQPRAQFNITANANNQTFTNDFLFTFPSNVYATVFKNGTLMDSQEYVIVGNAITINRLLRVDDVITVAATGILGGISSGGLANINLNGNIDTYLTGDGTWQPFTGNLVVYNVVDSNIINISNTANINFANITDLSVSNTANINIANITTIESFDLSVSNTANLGLVGNITILGGNPGDALTTDGSGSLSWSTLSNINTVSLNGNGQEYLAGNGVWLPSLNVGGSNTQIQYNNNGNLAGSANLTFNNTTNTLSITNIETSYSNIGNLNLNRYQEKISGFINTGPIITPDFNQGSIFKYIANSDFTFNGFTNAVAGRSATVIVKQDATGGRLMTSTMKFAQGIKNLSSLPNEIDIISVFYDGTDYYAALSIGFA